MSGFVPFFFDGNRWSGLVRNEAGWHAVLSSYPSDEDLEHVLQAKMAQMSSIHELPAEYFTANSGVVDGLNPSFGFRREHISGTVKLEAWATVRGMNLREMAANRIRA